MNNMRTIQLRIDGMTCLECARRVEHAITRVPGVEAARVDYRGGQGTVEVSDPVPDRDLLLAVEESGYRAEAGASRGTAASTTAGRSESQRAKIPSGAGPTSRAETSGSRADREGEEAAFDLLVIGTGGAGVAAAIQAAELGARVGIAESGVLGGTCVNVGCIPSKNLIEAAAHYHAARRGFPGIGRCEPVLDWREVIAWKDTLVRELRESKYADVLRSYAGITLLEGPARLLGGRRVRVGEVERQAGKIVLATGTSPASPPIEGLDRVAALNSTTAMELDELPRSLIVLGGSAVGLELAQIFARFGTKVTVLELLPRILASEDETVSEALRDHLEQEGLEIHTGVTAFRVERDGREVVIHVRQGSLSGEFRAERLLVATGRRANTDDLGLEVAGVDLTAKGFIEVDATLRTTNPDVYAAGDVTGGPGFVYVAAAGGRLAAENALTGGARELDLSAVPSVTFTSPQAASVGLTEAKARAAGYHVEVSVLELEHVPRALVSRDVRGLVKIVAEAGSGRVLGVHAVGPHAGELLGEATLAVRLGLTIGDLTSSLHPYLTWVEGLKLAAQSFAVDVSRLSCCA
jgi:mercuric reductase